MPSAFWDLEISYQPAMAPLWADTKPDAARLDIWDFWPFGISVGAVKLSTSAATILWYDTEKIWDWTLEGVATVPALSWSLLQTQKFLQLLWDTYKAGFKLFTMNGTGFDWQLLYRITEDTRCIKLALKSYDPCFQVLCMTGFPVGLESLAVANNVPRAYKEMEGKSAPKEWYLGNFQEVMTYVTGDVIRLEGVVKSIIKQRGVYWQTNSGGLRWLMMPQGFLTVEQCLKLPFPDTSWQTNPIKREDNLRWMECDPDRLTLEQTNFIIERFVREQYHGTNES